MNLLQTRDRVSLLPQICSTASTTSAFDLAGKRVFDAGHTGMAGSADSRKLSPRSSICSFGELTLVSCLMRPFRKSRSAVPSASIKRTKLAFDNLSGLPYLEIRVEGARKAIATLCAYSRPYNSISKAGSIKPSIITKQSLRRSRTTSVPNICLGFSDIAEPLCHLKRPAEALASFEKALALKPDHVEALCNRGISDSQYRCRLDMPAEGHAARRTNSDCQRPTRSETNGISDAY